jgi:hypothetical protein
MGGNGSSDSVKKSFGRVPTSTDVNATAMHDGERTWTNPSTVKSTINGPDDRSPPRLHTLLLPRLLLSPRAAAMGGTDATANIGLGNVAVYEPCFFCDLDVNFTVVGTMPSPPILLLLLPFGNEVISTVEHSRPLARKTRLVIGLIKLSSDVE